MRNYYDMFQMLPQFPSKAPILQKHKLSGITGRLFDNTSKANKFKNTLAKLQPSFNIDAIALPALVIPMYGVDDKLAQFKFISFDKDTGNLKTQNFLNINLDNTAPTFLWLNKNDNISDSTPIARIMLTKNYFDAERCATLSTDSIIYCNDVADIPAICMELCAHYPKINNLIVLAPGKQPNSAYTTLELPYIATYTDTLTALTNEEIKQILESPVNKPQVLEDITAQTKAGADLSKKQLKNIFNTTSLVARCPTALKYNDYLSFYNDAKSNRLYAEYTYEDEYGNLSYELVELSYYLEPFAFVLNNIDAKDFIIKAGRPTAITFLLPGAILSNLADIKTVFAEYNIPIFSVSKREAGLLQTYLQMLCFELTNEQFATRHHGWHCFTTTTNEKHFYNISKGRALANFNSDTLVFAYRHKRNKFKLVGEAKNFNERLLPLLKGNPALCCSLFRAMSAPLLRLLNINPVMFHYFCASRRGKSLMMAIGCAWLGVHKESDLVKSYETWAGSTAGITAAIPDFMDSLLALDDISTADDNPHKVKELIYTLSNGELGARATQQGTQRDAIQFKVLVDSTGVDKIKSEMTNHGIKLRHDIDSRCIDIALPSTEEWGIITTPHTFKTKEEFFVALVDVLTAGFRGCLLEAWLDLIESIYNNIEKLNAFQKKFKEFKQECSTLFATSVKKIAHQTCILNNIYLLGFTLQLAMDNNFIPAEALGFSPYDIVKHIFAWYVDDQEQATVIGFESTVIDKCREMISHKNKWFTTICRIQSQGSDTSIRETSKASEKHLGYMVEIKHVNLTEQNITPETLETDYEQKMRSLYYFTPDGFNTYFNSSSRTKTKEIKDILLKLRATDANEDGSIKRHRLPGNRALGCIFYVIDPHKVINKEEPYLKLVKNNDYKEEG